MNKHFERLAFMSSAVVIGLGTALAVTACQQSNVEASSSSSSVENQAALPDKQIAKTPVVSASGVGPIKIGMTVDEAERASEIDLAGFDDDTRPASCSYVKPVDEFPELSFMTIDGQIARLDLSQHRIVSDTQPPTVKEIDSTTLFTQNGIGIGSSQSEVEAAYPDIEKTRHKYVPDGYYLTVTSSEEGYPADLKLIFETDGTEVTYIRGGRSPEVGFVEGCA